MQMDEQDTAPTADEPTDEVASEIASLEERLVALRAKRDHKEYPKWVKDASGNDVIAETAEHEQELTSAPAAPAVESPAKPPDPLAGLGTK